MLYKLEQDTAIFVCAMHSQTESSRGFAVVAAPVEGKLCAGFFSGIRTGFMALKMHLLSRVFSLCWDVLKMPWLNRRLPSLTPSQFNSIPHCWKGMTLLLWVFEEALQCFQASMSSSVTQGLALNTYYYWSWAFNCLINTGFDPADIQFDLVALCWSSLMLVKMRSSPVACLQKSCGR